jgi:hypothetical protein
MSQVTTENNESTVQNRTYEEVIREVIAQTMKQNEDKCEVTEVMFYPSTEDSDIVDDTAFYTVEVIVTSHNYKGYNSLQISGRVLSRLIERMQELGFYLSSIRQFQNKKWTKESKMNLHFFSMDEDTASW